MTVAIVTDSASDLPPESAVAAGIRVVALNVHFAAQGFRAGVDLSSADFWVRMIQPDAPFPTTSAASPGAFQEAFEAAFGAGAEAIVCVDVSETLSGTIKSARIAAGLMPDREIHVVDSRTASMGLGLLALLASDLARAGHGAPEIVEVLGRRAPDVDLFVALDTLEYLRRGGRISGARAAIGTLLSVKPIITVRQGLVDVADRPRTRSRARERVIELLTERPAERLAILYAPPADPAAFRDEVVARLPGGIDPGHVSVQLIGPSVGPHLGPGCIGAVILAAAPKGPLAGDSTPFGRGGLSRGLGLYSAAVPSCAAPRPWPPRSPRRESVSRPIDGSNEGLSRIRRPEHGGSRIHDHGTGCHADQSLGRGAASVRSRCRSATTRSGASAGPARAAP